MTISSTATRKAGPYAGNGSTVAFAFTFKVFADSDLVVTHTDDNGVETVKTLTTHYTATLNANQNSNPGGTVTMLTAPATGEKLTITSAVPKTQAVNLSDGGGFFASVVNNALDRLTIFAQELAEQVSRIMKLPVSAADGTDPNLPTPEAGTVLGWNADGDAIINYLPTNGGMPDPGSITATYLANDAVEEEAILNGAVTTNKLGALAVTAAKLASNAVETAKIKDANVTAAKLAADAVETAKIKDANVTAAKLAADLVNALASGIPDGTDEFLFGVAGGSGVKKAAALTMKGYFSKAKAGTFAKPGGTGNSAVTGVGFTPKAIFIFAAVPGGGSRGSIGFGADATGRGAFYYDTGNVGLTLSAILYAGSAADLTSLDSDGFTLNWSNVGTTLTLAYLALGN